MDDDDIGNGTLLLLLLNRQIRLGPRCLLREEVSYFGEMEGRMAEKRMIIIIVDALAVGSSLSSMCRSGNVEHMEKKRMLPLLLPPRDSASGIVDDGSNGDGDDDDNGIARSKGGIVARTTMAVTARVTATAKVTVTATATAVTMAMPQGVEREISRALTMMTAIMPWWRSPIARTIISTALLLPHPVDIIIIIIVIVRLASIAVGDHWSF